MAFICCRYLAWSPSADICSHGSRPYVPPTASTGESSALWFLDRGGRAGRAGKHRLLLSSTASPFAGLNFQLQTCKKKTQAKGWDVEPSCVKMQYSQGTGGRESGLALLLVLANKHINSKVDNQVGCGGGGWEGRTEGQPLVLKEQFRGSSHGRYKV